MAHVRVAQIKALDLGLGAIGAGQPDSFLHPHHCGKFFSTTQATSHNATASKGQSQLSWSFFCAHASWLALLWYPYKVQGSLSQMLQLVMGRASFPISMTSGTDLLPALGDKGQRSGISPLPMPLHSIQVSGPALHANVLLIIFPLLPFQIVLSV